jgi:hypothetical protein
MEAPSELDKWMRKESRFWEQAREKQGFGRRIILALMAGLLFYLLRSFFSGFSFQ